ncbi:MAG: radical SAM protein [Candidatus Undinarchaeales archaeon]|jgi:tRNA A37 methylthiotransferase MiaB|nr:radical SAM protein [Candidatus Undinarchaeales archaeon]MDP7492120.1 radical SAM protein [Candidatus Undinarchaeales archaeon]
MADLVLVQPRIGFVDEVVSPFSLPLALLHACSRAVADFDVTIIDQRTDPRWEETLRREIASGPLLVGSTAMAGRPVAHMLEAASVVKKEAADVPFVLGGVLGTMLPELALADPRIDMVVRGEGEETLPALLAALRDGRPVQRVAGVSTVRDGRPVHAPDRPLVVLDAQPELPYHLVDVERYAPIRLGRRAMIMESSRGCPHRCAFCYNTVYNRRRWRGQSAERMVDRVRYVSERFGIGNVRFEDENLFANLGRVRRFARLLADEGLDVIWEAQGIRVESIMALNDEDLRLLERSGCRQLNFGVESGSQPVLDRVLKDIRVEDVMAVNRRLVGSDIAPVYNFMCGFPDEGTEDLRATVDLMFKLLGDNPRARVPGAFIFVPYPGTVLYEEAVSRGFDPPDSLAHWADVSADHVVVPWVGEDERHVLEGLSFLSMFLDVGSGQLAMNPAVAALARLYRPLARARVGRMYFDHLWERRLARRFVPE